MPFDFEERFFNEQRMGNGVSGSSSLPNRPLTEIQHNLVPVIGIFTKFDDLVKQVYDRSLTMVENRQVALSVLDKKFQAPLRELKFPPKAYLRLEKMQKDDGNHQDQVKELIEKTADSLDDLALKMLFVSVQQNNLELCLKYAVKYSSRGYDNMNMSELVDNCLRWFRHAYYNNYDYGKTEDDNIKNDRQRKIFDRDDKKDIINPLLVEFFQNCHQIEKLMSAKFHKPSLITFSVILICMENSFWQQPNSISFNDSFLKAFKLFIKSGTKEKLETSFKVLKGYPPSYSNNHESLNSSLLEILLEHRLPHVDNSETQAAHCIIC